MICEHYITKIGANKWTAPLPKKDGMAIYHYDLNMTESVEFYAATDAEAITHAREVCPFGVRLTKLEHGKVSTVFYERADHAFDSCFN